MALILGKIDITTLLNAADELSEALDYAEEEETKYPQKFKQASAIQCFECAYELAWKTMKRLLVEIGIETTSPKVTFREAARAGYISDPEVWFKFKDYRNVTSHVYDQEIAHDIYEQLRDFDTELKQFIDRIQKLT